MNPLLLTPLLNIGEKIFDKFFPDPEEAARAKIALATELASIDLEKDSAFRKFVVEYEDKGSEVHPVIQILRGSVRPVVTYTLAGFFLYGFINPALVETVTMDLLWKLNLVSLGFWYGSRSLEQLGFNFKDRAKK